MMGFWSIRAKDLREGDEVRITSMGGTSFLTVLKVEPADDGQVRVQFEWGWDVPIVEPFWDLLPEDDPMTVRR